MKKLPIFLFILLMMPHLVSAATVSGNIYDFSLQKIDNAIIEINTEPIQRQIIKNSFYSFNVPRGSYTITAKNFENKIIASENITINEEGSYTLDLIAFIDLDEEELSNDTTIDLTAEINDIESKNYIWLFLVIIIIGFIILYFLKIKNKPEVKEEIAEDDLMQKVLDVIKKEQRISQKELRKLFPYSEAKISLIITELESKGKIEKIKKGRTNVIIFKK